MPYWNSLEEQAYRAARYDLWLARRGQPSSDGQAMGYLDETYADIFRLTRLRRAERQLALKEVARREALRFSVVEMPKLVAVEFEAQASTGQIPTSCKRKSYRKLRHLYWRQGRRSCYFCEVEMTMEVGHAHTLTVDHLTPLSREGTEDWSNRVPCCWRCNNLKGFMTEVEFRTMQAGRSTWRAAAER